MQTLAPPPSPIPRQWAKSKGNCSPPPQPKPTPRSTQCLDVLHRQHACRVRRAGAIRLMAMLRRFSNSLLLEWGSGEKKPQHKTTTDFFGVMKAEHCRYALRCLQARQPTLQPAS
jgi:hypothetical protein